MREADGLNPYWRQYFITQKLRFDKGRAELAGFKSLLEVWILAALGVKFFLGDSQQAYWLIPVAIVVLVFLMWFVGRAWDWLGLYDEEANFAMNRHAFFKAWKKGKVK